MTRWLAFCQPPNSYTTSWDSTNRAPLDISEPTCECGNDKMLMLDGTLGDQCQNCQQIDEQGRHRRRCKRRCQRPCLRTPRHRQDPRLLRPGPPPPPGGSWPLRPLRSGLPPGVGTACWLAKRGLDLLRRLRSGQPWNPPAFRLDQPTTAHRRTLRAPVVGHHVPTWSSQSGSASLPTPWPPPQRLTGSCTTPSSWSLTSPATGLMQPSSEARLRR